MNTNNSSGEARELIKRSVDNQLLIINSENRHKKTKRSTNDFTVFVGENMSKKFSMCTVQFLRMPNSFYTVNANNKTLVWIDTTAASRTSVLVEGVYTPSTLATAVKTQLDADEGGAQTYDVTFSNITNKYTITGSVPTNFTLDFGSTVTTCAQLLGFLESSQSGFSTYTGEYVADLQPINIVNISTNIPFAHSTLTTSGVNIPGCVLSAPVDSNNSEFLRAGNDVQYIQRILGNIPNNIRVRVLDENGVLADLNGAEWSIGLLFE